MDGSVEITTGTFIIRRRSGPDVSNSDNDPLKMKSIPTSNRPKIPRKDTDGIMTGLSPSMLPNDEDQIELQHEGRSYKLEDHSPCNGGINHKFTILSSKTIDVFCHLLWNVGQRT